MARVLVVEDEPTMRELVTARLKAAGHQIVAAESGADAVEVAESCGALLSRHHWVRAPRSSSAGASRCAPGRGFGR